MPHLLPAVAQTLVLPVPPTLHPTASSGNALAAFLWANARLGGPRALCPSGTALGMPFLSQWIADGEARWLRKTESCALRGFSSRRRKLKSVTFTSRFFFSFLLLALLLGLPALTYAAVGGSISGTVQDPSGAVVTNATVAVINLDTGVRQAVTVSSTGTYSFPSLPVGRYDIDVTSPGFRAYRRANIRVDVNSALLVDAVLGPGIDNYDHVAEELETYRIEIP